MGSDSFYRRRRWVPLGLIDVGRDDPSEGLRRWRLGVPRFVETHPYVSLLISLHAYWLYAFAYEGYGEENNAFRHPMFGLPSRVKSLVADSDVTRHFLDEQLDIQRGLIDRLHESDVWNEAVRPEHLSPHLKLLQILDALSLFIAFGAQQTLSIHDVPRRNWEDRIVMTCQPLGNQKSSVIPTRLMCPPFRFI